MEEVLKENEPAALYEDRKFILKLEIFEGPLDLLLHFVKESKLSIREIKLADVTDRYLEYLMQLKELDMEKASEFVEIATILVEIKVKALLPKIEEIFADDPTDNPEENLKLQMEKYALFKEASEKLKASEEVNRFYKLPDSDVGDERIVLKDMVLEKLLDAFAKMLHKVNFRTKVTAPKNIVKDRFTVKDKIDFISQIVQIRKNVSFFELFERDYTKSEIINTFLALLELLRLQIITVEQNALYEDISISGKETA